MHRVRDRQKIRNKEDERAASGPKYQNFKIHLQDQKPQNTDGAFQNRRNVTTKECVCSFPLSLESLLSFVPRGFKIVHISSLSL